MVSVAAVVAWTGTPADNFNSLQQCAEICNLAVVVPSQLSPPSGEHTILHATNLWSPSVVIDVLQWFRDTGATYLLWLQSPSPDLPARGLRRMIRCLRDTRAAILYSDYFVQHDAPTAGLHPLVDYQPGSLRDDFDFGHLLLIDGRRLAPISDQLAADSTASKFGGWYELRLRLSESGPLVRLPEPTYTVPATQAETNGESHFRYVDPRHREYQLEMERIATAHLKRIGAQLAAPAEPLAIEQGSFPVEASVVIPVRNRQRTVAEAVSSALTQQPDFDFNVIVVDNYSDDGTTQILSDMAARDQRLVHLVPHRRDLGIGGCWNEAVDSEFCGRYAVQLDSDDLYASSDVLQRMVGEFHRDRCAMVIGSYTIVDFDLNPLPPGLVDHGEWTDENGHNNALRIAGLGAPRAFHVPTLRNIGFPNVSFGEDYAVALTLAGRYKMGRIYDSLYWCRRWEDNTDHALSLETSNRYAAYKDRIRSIEIAARQHQSG